MLYIFLSKISQRDSCIDVAALKEKFRSKGNLVSEPLRFDP